MSSNFKIAVSAVLLVSVFSGMIVWINLNMFALQKSFGPLAEKNAVDLVKLDNDYRASLKSIVSRYENLKDQSPVEQFSGLRNELLSLRTPAKFRELHINLVFAFDQRIESIKTGDQQKKVASDATISKARSEYSWLN
ncbi:hypothetical protein HGA64_00475 [Candidatus Falkowbacteria bacterium]|nr:hypothetical protein [Candidatus Falkowbacteria bacterium]